MWKFISLTLLFVYPLQWLYEPQPQNTNISACAVFNFNMSFTAVPIDEEDLFNCDAAKLPEWLNQPNFFNENGYLHVYDSYILEFIETTYFTLTNASDVRLSAASDELELTVVLGNNRVLEYTSSMGASDVQLYRRLEPGTYFFQIFSWNWRKNLFCPLVHVEVAIAPVGRKPATLCPPFTTTDLLPSLPATLRAPLQFGVLLQERLEFLWRARIRNASADWEVQWPLEVTETVRLRTGLYRDFLSSAASLSVWMAGTPHPMYRGVDQYNHNFIDKMLDAGSYTLRIRFPNDSTVACSVFNFYLSLMPAEEPEPVPAQTESANDGGDSGDDEPDDSVTCERGQPLPLSLNTMRFLGADNIVNWQSDSILVRVFTQLTRYIEVTPKVPSILRARIDARDDLRISMELRQLGRVLESAGDSGILVYELDPNVKYFIRIVVQKEDPDTPICNLLNAQFTIAPNSLVGWPRLPLMCDNVGGSHWPPAPPTRMLTSSMPRYTYTSEKTRETLYVQQVFGEKQEQSYTFTLSTVGRLWAQLGYDFHTSFMVMRLINNKTRDEYLGENHRDTNVLVAEGLEPGVYVLTLAEGEVVSDREDAGCARFTFSLLVEQDQRASLQEQSLPTFPRYATPFPPSCYV